MEVDVIFALALDADCQQLMSLIIVTFQPNIELEWSLIMELDQPNTAKFLSSRH